MSGRRCCVWLAGVVVAIGGVAAPTEAGPVGRLVYGVNQGGYQGICVMDLPAGTVTQIVPPGAFYFPHWSPDGKWIAFSGGTYLNSQIYVVRPDGTGLRRVTPGFGDLYEPSFSPDGTKLAFAQVYGHLFIINFDGTNLTDLGVRASGPEWSPDGTKIAYSNWAQEGGYNSDLFVYDLTTHTETQITHRAPGEAFNLVAWSPDSNQLAVSKMSADGYWDVWKMNADGSNPVKLTPDSDRYLEAPGAWSSDGQYIFFLKYDPATDVNDIWVMHPDGSGRVNVTNSPLVNESMFSFFPTPDTTPPVVGCSTNKSTLWPPNHQMEQVIVYVQASDDTTPANQLRVAVTVSSNEPDDANGDGHFTGDVNGHDGFTAPVPVPVTFDPNLGCFVGTVALRAERDGGGVGRVYSIVCQAQDLAGNTSAARCAVAVSHDQRKK